MLTSKTKAVLSGIGLIALTLFPIFMILVIVMATAHAERGVRERCESVGGDYYGMRGPALCVKDGLVLPLKQWRK